MDALSVNPLALAAVNAAGALRPPALAAPATSNTLTAQDLAQSLFRQSLQAATGFPLAEPAAGTLSLVPEATASLLASLSAPQAPSASAAAAPAAASVAPLAGGALPTQDAIATSASLDFAMEAALRFGSGVAGSSALAPVTPVRDAELVRDAASVIRTGNVQPHAGGPGPEAFLQTQANLTRFLREYQASAIPAQPQTAGLDLLA